jgi:hypothetical protein
MLYLNTHDWGWKQIRRLSRSYPQHEIRNTECILKGLKKSQVIVLCLSKNRPIFSLALPWPNTDYTGNIVRGRISYQASQAQYQHEIQPKCRVGGYTRKPATRDPIINIYSFEYSIKYQSRLRVSYFVLRIGSALRTSGRIGAGQNKATMHGRNGGYL